MVCSKLKTAHLTPESIIEEADTPLKQEATKLKEAGEVCASENVLIHHLVTRIFCSVEIKVIQYLAAVSHK